MASDPLLGEVVDRRYRIVDRLGTGGMGTVYLAEHVTLARKFAIKVLRQEFTEQPEFLQRFLRESRAATAIDHPNVIEVIDTGTLPDERAYYVMEHLRGEDLMKTLRRERRLAWPRARHVALQVCAGLGAAHARGIVHRDLKPANCFRVTRGSDDDFIKLLDFGIVKLIGESGAALTGDGTLLGTAHYMAPEQAMGLAVDHRVDVYALGVMLYQLVSGRHPWPGRAGGLEMLYAILHDAPVPLREAAGEVGLPRGLEEVVARAMHRDAGMRTGSMAELAEALAGIGDEVSVMVPRREAEKVAEALRVAPSHSRTKVGAAAPVPGFDSKVTTPRTPRTGEEKLFNNDEAAERGSTATRAVDGDVVSAGVAVMREPVTTRVEDATPLAVQIEDEVGARSGVGEAYVHGPMVTEVAIRPPVEPQRSRSIGWAVALAVLLVVAGYVVVRGDLSERTGEIVVAEAASAVVSNGSDEQRTGRERVAAASVAIDGGAAEGKLAERPEEGDAAERSAAEARLGEGNAAEASAAEARLGEGNAAEVSAPLGQGSAAQGAPSGVAGTVSSGAAGSSASTGFAGTSSTSSSSGGTGMSTAVKGRARVEAVVQGVRQKIQKTCRARLAVETVAVDVTIEARTGKLRRVLVAPPHDRTSTRPCVEQVFAVARFPAFEGKDYQRRITLQIRPKG